MHVCKACMHVWMNEDLSVCFQSLYVCLSWGVIGCFCCYKIDKVNIFFFMFFFFFFWVWSTFLPLPLALTFFVYYILNNTKGGSFISIFVYEPIKFKIHKFRRLMIWLCNDGVGRLIAMKKLVAAVCNGRDWDTHKKKGNNKIKVSIFIS